VIVEVLVPSATTLVGLAVRVECVAIATGTYTATITNSTVETVTVSAAFGGSDVDDTVDVSFITPTTGVDDEPVVVAMATRSTLTANPTNVVADGTSTSTITMQAKDAPYELASKVERAAIATTTGGESSSISGIVNLISTVLPTNGSATLSSVSDNADGTYTATITNNTVETVRVSAAFDGSDVNNAVDISFTFTSKTIRFRGLNYITMKSPSTGRIWLSIIAH
jgi:hypothetical protein